MERERLWGRSGCQRNFWEGLLGIINFWAGLPHALCSSNNPSLPLLILITTNNISNNKKERGLAGGLGGTRRVENHANNFWEFL